MGNLKDFRKTDELWSSLSHEVHGITVDAMTHNDLYSPVSEVLSYHPDYLQHFLAAQNFLLGDDGPLPYDYRHYLAIIASSRHACSYLVKFHERQFLLHCGNPEWLKGIRYAPRKIQDLYEINKILAHQPWLITKNHIARLLKGPEPWSLSELMHAIILMTYFHSLCSFIYGCDIDAELDVRNFTHYSTASLDNISNYHRCQDDDIAGIISERYLQVSREDADNGLESLIEKIRRLAETSVGNITQEELLKQFQSVEHQSVEITIPTFRKSTQESGILRYVIASEFAYSDFATRESANQVATFRACDYSWHDHGFSLANRLYTDVGNVLDDKYSMAANLTYYTMGDNHEVDTSCFRQAIWNYIHCMYGIRHDDYDYSEVNQLLERKFKAYIKTVTCYPERLQQTEYDSVMKKFKHSEKVHINLILMEARQQAELLYALRALNQYIT